MTEYRVPTGYGEAELLEKRSRFIGRVWPVETEEDALSHLNETRQLHRDASHNVYAYIIKDGSIMRYSDDGEPQGTSGMPTLNVFRGEEIYNVCCVITRYFGGTLLGTGGLARAYSQTAKLALEAAGISVKRLWKQVLLSCQYSQFDKIKSQAEDYGAIFEDIDYGTDIMIYAMLPEDAAGAFCEKIFDVTSGTVKPEITGEEFRAIPI